MFTLFIIFMSNLVIGCTHIIAWENKLTNMSCYHFYSLKYNDAGVLIWSMRKMQMALLIYDKCGT